MSEETTQSKEITTIALFQRDSVQKRFEKMLGDNAAAFISSVLQVVNDNNLLSKAKPMTVLNAAATAASMNLPINQNLGYAWIVPYKDEAQFQMGWKGYVQLALRTNQYRRLNCVAVYRNQFTSFNAMTEDLTADFNKVGDGDVIGYVAYFRMNNGFEKTSYWSKDEVIAHAKKYSKAYSTRYSPWSDPDQFDAMAKKTVLKNLLSKWGMLSIEMHTAVLADQAVVSDDGRYRYVDNTIDVEAVSEAEETARIIHFISGCVSMDELDRIQAQVPDANHEVVEAMNSKATELRSAPAPNTSAK